MATASLNGIIYANMVRGGAAELCKNRQIVNDLNVFPIPDGDTGDNMFMTIDSGVVKLGENESEDLFRTASALSSGMLSGARGNSGAILSRIFAGISKGFEGLVCCDAKGLSRAFKCGVTEAYTAVKVPVEGTILTVFKDAVNYADSRLSDRTSIEEYFDLFIAELYRSLDRTPELLDVLKEAGVVDSGGAGFVYIAEGMKNALSGETVSYESSPKNAHAADVDISTFTPDSVLEFGYCTEFLLRLQNAKCSVADFDERVISDFLDTVGDSVVIFKDGSLVKVHVHTMNPGSVLNYCQQFGEFLTLKIENMTLQHNETNIKNEFKSKNFRTGARKKYGLVPVAAGTGVKNTFLELGCDAVVDGGQSMNPSVADLIDAFDRTNAAVIYVFPNNSNIIMTANQAAELYKDSDVRVVETHTVGEGYAAVSVFDTSSDDPDVIFGELTEASEGVVTAMVSRAIRDSEKDGVIIHKDDYIGFTGSRIYVDDASRIEAAKALSGCVDAGGFDILILLKGADADPDEAGTLSAWLSEKYRGTEVILIDGGQPVYDYIMILE
ncbi:MAG: DAK2 domain-containing protein [Clostridia bacterium]|nr:DAK2 domain-containing protein [Clostridia bacterium]